MAKKRNVVLYLDKELVEKTRSLGFNLSKTFENYLKQLLHRFSTGDSVKNGGDLLMWGCPDLNRGLESPSLQEMGSISEILSNFEDFCLTDLQLSSGTVKLHKRLIQSFLRLIEKNPREVTVEELRDYLKSIREEYAPSTYKNSLAALKRFYRSARAKRSKTAKPMNPHAFRHSRLTELAKFLSDAKLKIFAGWSANSTMSSVYVHLSGKDLDSDLFRIAGVETQEEETKESPLKSKKCLRCNSLNDGVAEFCNLCGRPFDEAKVVEATLETHTMKAGIQELKEKSEVANDVIDSMWEVIEKLKSEISR